MPLMSLAEAFTFKRTAFASFVLGLLLRRYLCLSFFLAEALACLLGFISWASYASFIYPFYLSPLRHVPTVPGCPLWGHLVDKFSHEYGALEREYHLKYGPIVRFFFPFGSERLSITDDEAIKQITVKDAYNYTKPQNIVKWMASILGYGVLIVDGEEHIRQRKALSPAFSTASIRDLAPIFWEKGLLLAGLLALETNRSPVSTSIELLEWMNRATLDVIGAAAFGYDIGSLEDPNVPLRKAYSSIFAWDFMSCLAHFTRHLTPLARFIPFKANRDMVSTRKVIVEVASDIVQRKKGTKETTKDIIGLVVRQNESLHKDDTDILSFETIRDQIMTFLGAGHDTTATAVAWTLDLLAKHPQVQKRLREEIRAAFPTLCTGKCSPDELASNAVDIDQLPYLSNVCRESLRYIPPIPATCRVPLTDTRIMGTTVPKDTRIFLMANAINRMPSYWGADANTFNPDRWDNLPATYTTNAYFSFLHGPRSCIGRKFAETEMKIFICCLVSRFNFEQDFAFLDQEHHKMWRLVLRPRDGINLKLTLLNSASI